MRTAYPQYSSRSGWNALLPPRTAKPALEGDHAADVVVVGAGFTGLACARRWQELDPRARIVVLDASEVGEGNPGRNSGFLLEIALADDADAGSRERMEQCNRLTREAMQRIVADVSASEDAIDLSRAGTYRAAGGEVGMRALHKYEAFLQASGLPYRRLDQAQLRAELGTDFYGAGLYSPDCYLAQPAAVIRAIAVQLPESVELFENSPVTGLRRSGAGWQVSTAQGQVSCRKLVLANNSFARNLGIARSRLAAVYTYAGITPVLDPGVLAELGSNPNWGVLPMHRLGSTLRRTADGRLLIRSLHDYESEGEPARVERDLADRLWRRFPQLRGARFEQLWGGAVGFTYNAAPLWGEHEPGLFVSCGCNGGGTVKGTLFGRLLAELANGEAVPDVTALFGRAAWMPPEPARGIGFRVRAALESWQGRSEL
ncbi:MAG: FAD-binding oxidoreductase [Halieaceae bacterium]|jgi:glycine/D-amino acid oxidase-like deaminating enzyme|nr:FAD-binding oxidoreductase [Halieaceae bacterium]